MSTASTASTASTCSDDSSSVTSSNSICNELDDLLERCEQLHEHIQNSTETLHAIHQMIETNGSIKITLNGATRDFDEVLEELHAVSMVRVRNGEQNNFGVALLDILEKGCLE
jgi:hypothetical protein